MSDQHTAQRAKDVRHKFFDLFPSLSSGEVDYQLGLLVESAIDEAVTAATAPLNELLAEDRDIIGGWNDKCAELEAENRQLKGSAWATMCESLRALKDKAETELAQVKRERKALQNQLERQRPVMEAAIELMESGSLDSDYQPDVRLMITVGAFKTIQKRDSGD